MPIEIPKGLPFSVDTWRKSSSKKLHHFLTHAHMDHLQGITGRRCRPIYSTSLTRRLILQFFPDLDDSMFVSIEVGESLVVEDSDGDFVVTAFDANHCPGAVMFLFEGKFGNILHTGDCRLTPDCLQNLPLRYIGKRGIAPKCQLDCIFLDCTFGGFTFDMPSKRMAIQQVINCIWEHPDAPRVDLACDLLGQEEILVEVSKVFGEKIYVDSTRDSKCFQTLQILAPEIISEDSASRFRLLGFSKLQEVVKYKLLAASEYLQPEPLVIRPSTQWYAHSEGILKKLERARIDQAVRDVAGIWHVCYSIHSSKDELEWALECLAPKWVVSTTPPFRAMGLDYMKKHCLGNPQAINDCVLKLLNMKEVPSLGSDECCEILECSEDIGHECTETQCEPVVISTHNRKRLSLSPPGKRPVITLFGRARLGLFDDKQPLTSISLKFVEKQDDNKLEFENDVKEKETCISVIASDSSVSQSNLLPVNITKFSESYELRVEERIAKDLNFEDDVKEKQADITDITETRSHKFASELSSVKLSTLFSENRRKFYHSSAVLLEKQDDKLLKYVKEADFSDISETRNDTDTSGSSVRLYSENMRNFYRSMNVPLPQRLPSLVKLMNGIKSRRR